jgi:hypothetical protein
MSRRNRLVVDDPVFGRLLFHSAWWSGEAAWHGASRIGVMIFREPEEPNETDRKAFVAVRDSYALLLPKISHALFSLWEASSANRASAGVRNSAELFALLHLECVCIERSGSVELLYEGNSGLFTVRVDEGNVQPGAFDVGAGSQTPI